MGQTAEELREQLDSQRNELGHDLDAIGDRVSPGRIVERRKAAVRDSIGRARNAVMGSADTAASSTTHLVKDAASAVGDAASAAPRAVTSGTQGNPFAAGMIAFGAGALLGSLLPKTEPEQRAAREVQPTLEAAASEAGEQAHQIADTMKEHASDAAQRVQEKAHAATDDVKTDATSAVEETKTAAQRSGST